MLIDLTEMNIIYILNSLNFFMRCMEYHYQINDIKGEVKKYINYENYDFDYENIRILHRYLSTTGNKEIYNISNNVFFKGQADYLCSNEKNFKFLKDKNRYITNEKNKFKFFKINIDKLKKIV